MDLKTYLQEIDRQLRTGLAREHSYRPALQQLLAAALPDLTVTNEPARIACGAPDFILTRRKDGMPVAFLEAKDIDDGDLDGRRQHREQFTRYKASLDLIVLTDYLDFHLYRHGEWVENLRLGEVRGDRVCPVPGAEECFDTLVTHLSQAVPQRITSATRLASIMAAKARLLAESIRLSFDTCDENEAEGSPLQGQFEALRRILIHDLTPEGFADIYAQTIAYGLFAARLHDPTPDTFSRQEAATLIPRSNPFLRQIFQNIAGYDLDNRIAWLVDDLAATFRTTDLRRVMQGYGDNRLHSDPMIHFYEDFLSAYDPRLRKAKGVWYTPQPVVGFIIAAVDEVLRRDFSLPSGLADYSQVEHEVVNEWYVKGRKGERPTLKKRFHRVQILDPATGTGTFLAEVVSRIYDRFRGMEGMWQGYVDEHLLPRLCGFELLMASYAIAHLKLDLLLHETGYRPQTDRRLGIYLTNSLEECHPDTGSLFAQWLSNEANAANRIKRDTPVMVMLGNPPYNGESSNKGEWIMRLMETYKKEPGGKDPLKERNPKWLNDDYVKFIRMAQDYIERGGEGILAFINPHGFLDNPTFRGMRWSLLQAYDAIYTVNLHGNSKKKETCPDGSKDENVFDIMQGVSINIFVKTGNKAANTPAKVYYYDLYGKRQAKYDFLTHTPFSAVDFHELHPQAPMYFFVPKDFRVEEEYNKGFGVNELFEVSSIGIVTTKDAFLVCDTEDEVKQRISNLIALTEDEVRQRYDLKDSRDWSIGRAKADVGKTIQEENIRPFYYRQFDTKFLYYTGLTNGIVAWPRYHSMRHLLHPRNLGLLTCRQLAGNDWYHVSITNKIVDDCCLSNKTKERGYVFPLYQTTGEAGSIFAGNGAEDGLVPNFNPEIVRKIETALGESIEPQELFDYLYAVLHAPAYRRRYREFLKIDFPRIPYPADKARYHRLADLGCQLRHLHLLEGAASWAVSITYPVSGTNEVSAPHYANGRVYINESQYFGNVPEEAWNFYIGGYQPAQKWLKDRRGQTLRFADIRHYQEIVTALAATAQLMEKVDA